MVDTGNQVGAALMSEKQFRDVDPNGELQPIDLTVTGAATNSSLEVLGKPKKPIEVTFYNASDKKQSNIVYHMRPIVVRNLAFPLLLSWSDLKALKAHINIESNQIVINGPNGPSTYPLVGAPRTPTSARTCGTVTIQPRTEGHIMVNMKNSKVGDEVIVDPSEEFILKSELLAASVICHVNADRQVPVRVYNPSDQPILVKNNVCVGIGTTKSALVNMAIENIELSVNATNINTDLLTARPLTEEALQEPKTRKQLKERIQEDLGFN